MIGLAPSGPPDGFTSTSGAETERGAQDRLLVAELRVQLGDIDGSVGDTGGFGGESRRLRSGEVTHAQGLRLDPVLDAPDPRGSFARAVGRGRRPRSRSPRPRR